MHFWSSGEKPAAPLHNSVTSSCSKRMTTHVYVGPGPTITALLHTQAYFNAKFNWFYRPESLGYKCTMCLFQKYHR